MTMQEILNEIIEIIEYRKKDKYRGLGFCGNRKYSLARLKRLRLMLNEMIKKEEW